MGLLQLRRSAEVWSCVIWTDGYDNIHEVIIDLKLIACELTPGNFQIFGSVEQSGLKVRSFEEISTAAPQCRSGVPHDFYYNGECECRFMSLPAPHAMLCRLLEQSGYLLLSLTFRNNISIIPPCLVLVVPVVPSVWP